jgi:outer membrane protein
VLGQLKFPQKKGNAMIRITRYVAAAGSLAAILMLSLLPSPVCAQISPSTASFEQVVGKSYTRTSWFPDVWGPYLSPNVPPFRIMNSPRLDELIQNGVMKLSLDNAIALAIENNLNIAVQRYNPEYAVIDRVRAESGQATRGISGMFSSNALFSGALGGGISAASTGFSSGGAGSNSGSISVRSTGAVGSFDPYVGVSGGWAYNVLPLTNNILNGVHVLNGNIGEYNVFFGQEFPTGTSYQISAGGFRTGTNAIQTIYNPEVLTGLTVGISQNLLNGYGYRANAKFIRIADNEIGISKDYFKEQIITVIQQVINDYWALAEDKENVDVAQEAVNYNQQLLKQNQEQVKIGTLAPLDVIQAESALATAQQNLIVAQTTYRQQQEVMKTDIAKKVNEPLLSAAVRPTDTLPQPEANAIPSLEQAIAEAHQNRPEVDLDQLNLKDESVVLKANRNSLLPTLNAFATYATNGLSGEQLLFGTPTAGFTTGPVIGKLPGGINQALSQLFRNQYPSYSVGFQLVVPIRNRAAQADAARALLEQHYLRTVAQQDLNTIDQAVREADVAVTQGEAGITAAQKAVDYNREQYVDEQKKFKVGESTVALVIQMQNSLTGAEGNLVTAQARYASALIQFEAATGTLLQKNNIELTEALTGTVPHRTPNIPGTPVVSGQHE